MADFNTIYWSIFTIMLLSTGLVTSAKLYVLDDKSPQKVHDRVPRQTHPAATIAKLSSQDNSAFIPIVGPTQSLASQTPFANPTDFFPGNDFPSLHTVPNTLVDYLVPPSLDSPASTLNFQDPAANLHNLQNNIDNFEITSSPTPSPATNHNFQLPNNFQSAPNFQNQINNLQHLQTTPSTFVNEQVQSVTFQNPSFSHSATPSLTSPASSAAPTPSAGQTFSNKISNTNRDGFTPISNANHFPNNQFTVPTPPPPSPSFTRNEHDKTNLPSGKWDLGFDANEILTPPRDDSFGRVGEYDTINVNKFRRPNTNLNPPVPNNESPNTQNRPTPSNQFFNQFSPPQNNVNQFNQFSGSASGPTNDVFTPISNNQFTPQNNQFSPNRENTNEQHNVVWGNQKQPVTFSPTTSAPFLPTIPPNTQNSQHVSNFQNVNQPPPAPHNFQNNVFNSAPPAPPQQLQQLQFTQPPPPPSQQLFDFNQNFAIDTPLTSQFDSFLPQGTVADHTFQSFNENGRHFLKKRQDNGEEEVQEAEEYEEEEPQSNYPVRPFGRPVYSFVKTDRDGHFKWSVRHPSKR